jgi:DNA mismatch repair protein MutS2
MSFIKGDKVFVKSLKRWGRVVGLTKGKHRVLVGAVEVICPPADLTKDAAKDKRTKLPKYHVARHHPALKPDKHARGYDKLDLHGMRVLEAMAAVERMIDRAIIADLDRLEIVHGVGTGRIMMALHKYLATLDVVSSYRLDEINPGVTWVYF